MPPPIGPVYSTYNGKTYVTIEALDQPGDYAWPGASGGGSGGGRGTVAGGGGGGRSGGSGGFVPSPVRTSGFGGDLSDPLVIDLDEYETVYGRRNKWIMTPAEKLDREYAFRHFALLGIAKQANGLFRDVLVERIDTLIAKHGEDAFGRPMRLLDAEDISTEMSNGMSVAHQMSSGPGFMDGPQEFFAKTRKALAERLRAKGLEILDFRVQGLVPYEKANGVGDWTDTPELAVDVTLWPIGKRKPAGVLAAKVVTEKLRADVKSLQDVNRDATNSYLGRAARLEETERRSLKRWHPGEFADFVETVKEQDVSAIEARRRTQLEAQVTAADRNADGFISAAEAKKLPEYLRKYARS